MVELFAPESPGRGTPFASTVPPSVGGVPPSVGGVPPSTGGVTDVTVSVGVAVSVSEPETPLTLKVTVVAAAAAVALRVKVAEPPAVTEVGLKAAVTPLGRPEAESAIVWVEPAEAVVTTDAVVVPPAASVMSVGLVSSEKLGAVVEPASSAAFGVPRPVGPSQPVPAVQSTLGLQVPFLPLVTSKKSALLP